MKIYCEPIDKFGEIETAVTDLVGKATIDMDEKTTFIIAELGKLALAQNEQRANAAMEACKFKIMWALREMDKELDVLSGQIIIDPNLRVRLTGFTREVNDKITQKLKEFFKV